MRKKLLILWLVFPTLIGCNLQPEQKCALIKTTTKIGLKLAFGQKMKSIQDDLATARSLDNQQDIAKAEQELSDYNDKMKKLASLMKEQILPHFEGENPDLTRAQLDNISEIMNAELDDEYKDVIIEAINLAKVSFPESSKSGKVLPALARLFKCIAIGATEATVDYATHKAGSREISFN